MNHPLPPETRPAAAALVGELYREARESVYAAERHYERADLAAYRSAGARAVAMLDATIRVAQRLQTPMPEGYDQLRTRAARAHAGQACDTRRRRRVDQLTDDAGFPLEDLNP